VSILVLPVIIGVVEAQAVGGPAPQCSTLAPSNCTAPQCWIDCASGFASETELRNAVEAANDCNPNQNFSRIIYFKGTGTCTVQLANNNVNAPATCPDLPPHFENAICLRGHDIWIGGSNATTFVYTGTINPCDPQNQNSDGPPAFVLRGHDNAVYWFDTRYFYEGIDVREGADHLVEDVSSDYFCDEAISNRAGTVDAQGYEHPTIINLITLRGHTLSSRCTDSRCGTDKGIEVAGGLSKITNSTFINVGTPIEVLGGLSGRTHTIGAPPTNGEPNIIVQGLAENAPCGPPFNCGDQANNPDKYCVGLEFSGGRARVEGVSIVDCKFGISIEPEGASLPVVTAVSNTIKNGYKSAFSVEDGGTLTGTGNRIKNAGFSNEGDSCRAAVTIYNNDSGLINVDLSGGNVFCQDTLKDIRNLGFVGSKDNPSSCTLAAPSPDTESATDNCWDANEGADVDIVGPVLTLPRQIGGCDCNSF
jgi:hypothetical protein